VNASEIVRALAIGTIFLHGVEGTVVLCDSISLLLVEQILLNIISNKGFSAGIEAAIIPMLTSVAVSKTRVWAIPVLSY